MTDTKKEADMMKNEHIRLGNTNWYFNISREEEEIVYHLFHECTEGNSYETYWTLNLSSNQAGLYCLQCGEEIGIDQVLLLMQEP